MVSVARPIRAHVALVTISQPRRGSPSVELPRHAYVGLRLPNLAIMYIVSELISREEQSSLHRCSSTSRYPASPGVSTASILALALALTLAGALAGICC
jgi:hypothetical protein